MSERFASYAYNHEDVLLWRVLRSIDAGAYVDIGAFDPDDNSVTKAFYDRGWRGLNLQPWASRLTRFRASRPQDINLHCVAGENPGRVRVFSVDQQGRDSTFCQEVAERHRQSGRHVETQEIDVRPWGELIADLRRTEIHFLRLDTTFLPPGTIRAVETATCRPWVILAMRDTKEDEEVSRRNSLWEEFERLGYTSAFFNGVSRFLVRRDKADSLSPKLVLPPTTLDDFTTPAERKLEWQQAALALEYRGRSVWRPGVPSREAAPEMLSDLQQRNFWMARRIQELEVAAHTATKRLSESPLRRALGAPGRELRRAMTKLRKRFTR